MGKGITIIAYLIILFMVPMIGRMEKLMSIEVFLSMLAVGVLLASQPRMNLTEARRNKQTDQGSMLLILVVSVLGHLAALIDWAYYPIVRSDALLLTGIGFMIGGMALRLWAIAVLKKAFSATLQIKEHQNLITAGPYSLVRHPSYTGAWFVMLGNALLFQSIVGVFIAGLCMLWVYLYRIRKEEKMLLDAFDLEYKKYIERTDRFIPGDRIFRKT